MDKLTDSQADNPKAYKGTIRCSYETGRQIGPIHNCHISNSL